MAAEGAAVIVCHAKDEFDAHMSKAKQAGKLVIIDFMSPTCPGCHVIAPVFAQWAKKFPAALFLEVNVYELGEVADFYKIESMPTFVLVKNDETLKTIVGPKEEEILDAINKYYVGGTPAASAAASA